MKLHIYRQRGYFGEHVPGASRWIVLDPYDDRVLGRFNAHRTALNFALWKSGLLKNYGGA